MSDSSSNDPESVLSRLNPTQVGVLLDILGRTTLRQVRFIESVYNEQAKAFDETLTFLKDIGWVRQEGSEIQLALMPSRFRTHNDQQFHPGASLADAIADTSNPYRSILSEYLVQFHSDGGKIVYRPTAQGRIKERAIRNFLIESGIVNHDTKEDRYVLNGRFAHLYLWAKNTSGPTSKTELMSRAAGRDALGTAAEIAVLEFERARVGTAWCDQVEHVSGANPAACFDIKSLSIDGNERIPRYIEVKAVPSDTYQFFWTAGELEAARLLRRSYFLYLLPALGGHAFDLSKIEIIEDPYSTVYQDPDAWAKEENVIICRRGTQHTNL